MSDSDGRSWLVYMIRADDGRYYTGITTDVARRWRQHSAGKQGAKFFHGRKPERLVYVEPGHDRSSASRREAAIKKLRRAAKHLLLSAEANALNGDFGVEFLTGISSGDAAAPKVE